MLHAIRSALGPVARVGKEITYLPTCPSTNDLHRQRSAAHPFFEKKSCAKEL